jgi:hypothetical protein
MSYFKKYPTLKYPFGGLTTTTVFQDIGVYIDILDRAKDDLAFYQFNNHYCIPGHWGLH